jgi:hypothetical protein
MCIVSLSLCIVRLETVWLEAGYGVKTMLIMSVDDGGIIPALPVGIPDRFDWNQNDGV